MTKGYTLSIYSSSSYVPSSLVLLIISLVTILASTTLSGFLFNIYSNKAKLHLLVESARWMLNCKMLNFSFALAPPPHVPLT